VADSMRFRLSDLAASDMAILNRTEHVIAGGVVTMTEEEYEVLSVTLGTYGRRDPRLL
jgi:hypothetical protein